MSDKMVNWYDRQRVDTSDMTRERDYAITRIGNIFARTLGDGVTSGLAVSDDSTIINQNVQNNFYDIFLDTIGNQVIQIFKATADNLQQVILYGRNVGAAGNISISFYTLQTPTNMNSALSVVPFAGRTISNADFGGAFGEVTVNLSTIASIATAGSLTIGHYYAMAIERDNAIGSIDLSYSTTAIYADGYIREYDIATNIYTNRTTWQLYFRLFSDCIQISAGYAYKLGDPIEVASAQYKINLIDTSGVTNYICIKYAIIYTDYESHPRTGVLTASRIQDSFSIVIRTNPALIASDEELLATTFHSGIFPLTIVDRRTYIPSDLTLWDNYTNRNIVLTGESCSLGLIFNDCVYYNNTNSQWEKASFTNLPQGMYTASGEILLFGRKTELIGLVAGSWYYMDATGNLTTTITHIRMGYAISATVFLLHIEIDGTSNRLYGQTVNNALAVNDCVYFTAGQWEKASIINLPQGILINKNGTIGEISLSGCVTGLIGLTANSWYYMNDTGNLTTTESKIKVGYAISTTSLLIDIDFSGYSNNEFNLMYNEFEFTNNGFKNIVITNILGNYYINNLWYSTGTLNTARRSLAGAGTQNSAINFGGFNAAGVSSNVTEVFNGLTWVATGNLNTARRHLAGCGTRNGALSCGGNTGAVSAVTELFNGATWAATGALNTARYALSACGRRHRAISFGGYIAAVSATTERFDGTAWQTDPRDMTTARSYPGGGGTRTYALNFGGMAGAVSAVTEKFNESEWIVSSPLNTARQMAGGSGTQNSALSFGGDTGAVSAVTEKFNGLSWIAKTSMPIAKQLMASSGTGEYALSSGGDDGAANPVNTSEKYVGIVPFDIYGIYKGENRFIEYKTDSQTSLSIEGPGVLTCEFELKENLGIMEDEQRDIAEQERWEYGDGIWSTNAGWNLNTARYELAGSGFQNSALSFGGFVLGALDVAEKFNGLLWSLTDSLNTARHDLAGAGIQNSTLSFGGYTNAAVSDVAEKFNGLLWSLTDSLNTARRALAGAGTQNSTLCFGGNTGALSSVVEKFNGSIWSATGNMNYVNSYLAGSGTQNSALGFGGSDILAYSAITEAFNGSIWVVRTSLNTARNSGAGSGTQNSALGFGGFTGAYSAITEAFNGSIWVVRTSLNTARRYLAGAGTKNSALSFGGYVIGGSSPTTEKFNTEFTLPFVGQIIADITY